MKPSQLLAALSAPGRSLLSANAFSGYSNIRDASSGSSGGNASFAVDGVVRLSLLTAADVSTTTTTPQSVTLQNQGNTAVKIGTPPQTFTLQIDTGSSALWVGSAACDAQQRCNDGRAFDASKSSTFADVSGGATRTIRYGAGAVSGFSVTDTVAIGAFSVPDQMFILVNKEDSVIFSQQNGMVDGLIGFAWENGAKGTEAYYPTVIGSLISKNLISQPVFSIWLDYTTDISGTTLTTGGELVIGGIDNSRFSGSLTTFPVVNQYFWAISLVSVSIGSNTVAVPDGSTAMFDSGTSLIQVEQTFLKNTLFPAIYSAAGASMTSVDSATGLYIIPCSAISKVPTIAFGFGQGVEYGITGSDYILRLDSFTCAVGLMPGSGVGSNMWILGDNFLRKHYSVYDFGKSLDLTSGNGPTVSLASSNPSSFSATTKGKSSTAARESVSVWMLLFALLAVALV